MLRFLYTLAMYLATPVIVVRLAVHGVRYRGYLERWRERFGRFPDPGLRGSIWVHAVSVGEVNAAVPLIHSLRKRYAPRPMVVTTVTPTGSERARSLFGDEVFHVYLPYDLPPAVARFLDRIRPALAVVNARLSERSLRAYRPIRALVRRALANVALVAAQSRADATRYRKLGAIPSRVHVSGNLKYDMPLPSGARQRGMDLRRKWGDTRPVWIAASTHEGEELAAFKAHLTVLARMPDALLLVAPRHPERFRLIEHSARNLGFMVAAHGADDVDTETQCLVIDAMGVMMRYFAAADLAFVGGSLVPIGGHNVLEPAAMSKPVVVGPNTFNFAEITRTLIEAGGARRVASSEELGTTVLDLLRDSDELARMGTAARSVCARERGAARRTMVLLGRIFARARYASSALPG
jgi:3-deoxy-D-manno-octulosonic-acid transferase